MKKQRYDYSLYFGNGCLPSLPRQRRCQDYQAEEPDQGPHRHDDFESFVVGLVMEEVHPHQASDAAPDTRHPQQGAFADPVFFLLGFLLVDAIEREGQEIDEDEVGGDEVLWGEHGEGCFLWGQKYGFASKCCEKDFF